MKNKSLSKEEYIIKREIKWFIPEEIKVFFILMTPMLTCLYLGVVFDWKEIILATLTCYLIIYAIFCFITIKLCREVKYKMVKIK